MAITFRFRNNNNPDLNVVKTAFDKKYGNHSIGNDNNYNYYSWNNESTIIEISNTKNTDALIITFLPKKLGEDKF